MGNTASPFYVIGGTLRHDSPSYVERRADRDLYEGLTKGEFCYVLTSRQMGKSSLMVRIASRLRAEGRHVVVLDLTAIGQNVTPEQWYDGLIVRLGRQLHLEVELENFWLAHERMSPIQRFMNAIRDLVMVERTNPIVIFVDEIDAVRSLPFASDEFFAAIRECYNRRSEDPEFGRLTFCLLGVATPSELMRDANTTPFNIGQRVELNDFTPEEAVGLGQGFSLNETDKQFALDRILHWTHGHPYLTQRLCRTVAQALQAHNTGLPILSGSLSGMVDEICQDLYLSNRARERDDNLLFVRERILRSPNALPALELYLDILQGAQIADDEANPLVDLLRLSGITRVEANVLKVRNRIYHHVFDDAWVRSNLPLSHRSEPKSIAVLPFVNMSADPQNEYLSDGITEDLIAALGQIPGLRVPSRTSAFVFKGKTEDIRRIGEQLRVATVLEGSVRKAGNKLRITTQLINVADGFNLWNARYDREMEDVFAIQDEISRAIVDALKVKLSRKDSFLTKSYTDNTEAYQLYLRGRYFYFKWTVEGFKRSIEYYQQAIEIEPKYGLAYAGLADSYCALWYFGDFAPGEAFVKTRNAATKAVELADTLAETHTALARFSCFHEWNWATAEKEFKRAIELDPNYVTAREQHAFYLTAMGRFEEAQQEARRAQELDPLSLVTNMNLGWVLWFSRKYLDVIELGRKIMEFEPKFFGTYWLLGAAYGALEMTDDSINEFEKAVSLGGGPLVIARLGAAYGRAGRVSQAVNLLKELEEMSQTMYVPAFCSAIIHVALNDLDTAFQWLEKACQERSGNLVYLKVDPTLQTLRDDPRLSALLQKIGLEK